MLLYASDSVRYSFFRGHDACIYVRFLYLNSSLLNFAQSPISVSKHTQVWHAEFDVLAAQIVFALLRERLQRGSFDSNKRVRASSSRTVMAA